MLYLVIFFIYLLHTFKFNFMENTRTCWSCKSVKTLDLFHNSKRDKTFSKSNKCKQCSYDYYSDNRERYSINQKEKYDLEKAKKRVYEWRIKKYGDKAKIREEKKLKILELKKQKEIEKEYKKNVLNPLKHSVRSNIWYAFNFKKFKKTYDSEKYLGCDYNFLVNHIESQFVKGMNWDNKEHWHIDHIIPLSHAKNVEELTELCHYSNLQPLWALDNINKRCKIFNLCNTITKKQY